MEKFVLLLPFALLWASMALGDTCKPNWDVPLAVTGVESDDVLNVRAGIGTSNKALFSLSYDEQQVVYAGSLKFRSDQCAHSCELSDGSGQLEDQKVDECKSKGHIWYRVATLDGSVGWASAKYLDARPQRSNPSFDCARASTQVERAVCNFPSLGSLDRQVAASYSALRENSAIADSVRQSQINWLTVRNACKDPTCLHDAYRERLQQLAPQSTASKREVISAGPALDEAVPSNLQVVDEFETTLDEYFAGFEVGSRYEDRLSNNLIHHVDLLEKLFPQVLGYLCWQAGDCSLPSNMTRKQLKGIQAVEDLLAGKLKDVEFDYDATYGRDELGQYLEFRPRVKRRLVSFSCVYQSYLVGWETQRSGRVLKDACVVYLPSDNQFRIFAKLSNWADVDRTPNVLRDNSIVPNDVALVNASLIFLRRYASGNYLGFFDNQDIKVLLEDFVENGSVSRNAGPYFFDDSEISQAKVSLKELESFRDLVHARETLTLCYEVRREFLVPYLSQREFEQGMDAYNNQEPRSGLDEETKSRIEAETVSEMSSTGWMLVPEEFSNETRDFCALTLAALRLGQF